MRTWIDNELNLGDSITEEVFTALRQCQAIVPVVTRGFAQSISSLREFYFFSLTHSYKQVYPLLSDVDQLEREKAGRWLNKRVTALKYFKFEKAKDLVKSLKEKVTVILVVTIYWCLYTLLHPYHTIRNF